MSTLFNNNNSEGGYRLRYMEVFNWGTFHGKVYKLQTNGQTSLLTGANGSGKTTLIDALLTLLVPVGKRFYNQSSGAESKKERDENSYFWGHFGKTYLESESRSSTEQLRYKADNPYSVLLACFQNAGTQHTITLVQVRWFSGGMLKKVFIVAPYPLNINEHFGTGHFDIKGDWKKKLTRQFPKTDLYDSFKEYAARFTDLFGLKEKALSLFNQTVGIKVLGDLTQFIRHQMLEEPDAEEQFKSLHDHYSDLLISHKAIQKDERQLALLEPVIANKNQLDLAETNLMHLRLIQDQLPSFLDKIEYNLLDIHIRQIEKEIDDATIEQIIAEEAIGRIEQEQKQLIAQKAALNIDGQIQLLNKDKIAETKERDTKKSHAQDYSNLAAKLGLHTDLDEPSFRENHKKVDQLQVSLHQEYEELLQLKFTSKAEKEKTELQIDQLQRSITSLLSRKNRIPQQLIDVRKRLLDLLETGESELPFAGELIKVKAGALHWEDAIERVLNNFALQLIVPEKYNLQVNQFVHTNNLQARLVYQRIDRRQVDSIFRWPTDDNALVNKLEIKEAGIYTKWIEQQLGERFNYHCTDNLEVFYGSQKAVTSNGLIRNKNRHEKDDRPHKWSKLNYTLGWENKETDQLLQQEKYRLEKMQEGLFEQLGELDHKIKGLENKRHWITLIAEVKSYNEIHWQQHATKIESLSRQIEDLKKSSDKYQTISDQLETVDKELAVKRKLKDEIIRAISKLDNDLIQKNQRKINIRFDELTDEGSAAIEHFAGTEKINNTVPETLGQMETLKKVLTASVKNRLAAANDEESKIKLATISLVNAFIHPNEKILTAFPDWSGDVMNISASLTSLEELEDLYNTIRNQRLVEHKRRFKDYMDKSMLDALTNYRTWLFTEEEKIKDVIEELNVPLKKITFNKDPDTYLQLECRLTKEQEIKLFKDQLSATIPNALELATHKDDAYREGVFNKIKDLVTELQKEEAWRKKVTDIRNWLTFSAREYSVVENKAGQYHDNTASYSGGQKAQFTYAILGAAIAHQFGIFQPGKQYKSLRFITVDEAFSKLDPEKSQFLMEFCAQLNLQILVVTPLDKINIAEPYIHAVHFVEIKNKKHSIVYNLTMDEYYEKKEALKQLAEITQ
ncbi:MAG: hypothetical protein JWP81_1089 [Ferruginibacter sp.]|nr:hypothetical protein [Ferruginibacter sp.]